MNFTDFITSSGKRINKEYFLNLIQVSKTDGVIDAPELEFLHKEGKKFGLTDPEIDRLISSESHHQYVSPYSLTEKFEHLYKVTEMILADDIVRESEMRMLRKFAVEAGFSDTMVDGLLEILLNGVARGDDEETLLSEFRKKYISS